MDKKEIPQPGDKVWIDGYEGRFIGFGVISREHPHVFEPMSSILVYFNDGSIENCFIEEASFKKPVKK